ncbi:MAG: D-alanyl-D-alanine carboxypeptidase/D-alanyl-D-alanine-endopeptidase [Cytophagaceae bacterium]
MKAILFLFLSFTILNSFAQDLSKLQSEVKKISSESVLVHGQLGISIRDTQGKIVYQHQGDKSLIPASNLKIISTATALGILGEDFRYQTKLEYDGAISGGILNGNIYVSGSGDPTLGSSRFKDFPDMDMLTNLFCDKIMAAGIKKINGRLIADETGFDKNALPEHWMWTDIGNYYGAPACGLNFNENLYKLYFMPGSKQGDSTSILRTEPFIPGLTFINSVKTGSPGSGDNAYIYGAPYSYQRFITGTIPPGSTEFSIKGSAPDPAHMLLYTLAQKLIGRGVEVSLPQPQLQTPGYSSERKNIYTQNSVSLKEIAKATNGSSINLYAEALLKTTGFKIKKNGSTKSGIRAVREYWSKKGLDTAGFFMNDGSGLSATNAIQANTFTQLLYLVGKESYAASFYESLPVCGVSGTMKNIGKGTAAEGRVAAKTGTINKVICYTGYVTIRNGQRYSFSILANNFDCSNSEIIRKLTRIMVLMAEL